MRRVFTNLTLDGRRVIARMLQAKMPMTKTEAMLGRDRSPLNGIAPGTFLVTQQVICGEQFWRGNAVRQYESHPVCRAAQPRRRCHNYVVHRHFPALDSDNDECPLSCTVHQRVARQGPRECTKRFRRTFSF